MLNSTWRFCFFFCWFQNILTFTEFYMTFWSCRDGVSRGWRDAACSNLICVTGGNGFIGSWPVRFLLGRIMQNLVMLALYPVCEWGCPTCAKKYGMASPGRHLRTYAGSLECLAVCNHNLVWIGILKFQQYPPLQHYNTLWVFCFWRGFTYVGHSNLDATNLCYLLVTFFYSSSMHSNYFKTI